MDYFETLVLSEHVRKLDLYRRYPIDYVPVNDPRNSRDIIEKFANDILYDGLVFDGIRAGFEHLNVNFKPVVAG